MSKRPNQRDRLLALLVRAHGAWVPLPEILALGIAQFGARLLELRRRGLHIENRAEHVEGKIRSYYRLIVSPVRAMEQESQTAGESLFPDQPERQWHRDDN